MMSWLHMSPRTIIVSALAALSGSSLVTGALSAVPGAPIIAQESSRQAPASLDATRLVEFNEMTAKAVRARKRGDFRAAIAVLDTAESKLKSWNLAEEIRLRLTYSFVVGIQLTDAGADPWVEDEAFEEKKDAEESDREFDQQFKTAGNAKTDQRPDIRPPTDDELESIAEAMRRLPMVPLFMQPANARYFFVEAIAAARRSYGPNHPDTALLEMEAGVLDLAFVDSKTGFRESQQALKKLERRIPANNELLRRAKVRLAYHLNEAGYHREAIPMIEKLIEAGEFSGTSLAGAYDSVGYAYHQLGLTEEALQARRVSVLIAEGAFGPTNRKRLGYVVNYAAQLGEAGEYREMLRWQEDLLLSLLAGKSEPQTVAIALHNLSIAISLAENGGEKAVEIVRRALALYSALDQEDTRSFSQSQEQLGLAEFFAGNLNVAERQFNAAIKLAQDQNDDFQLLYYLTRLGDLHRARGNNSASIEAYAKAVRFGGNTEPHPEAILARRLLANGLLKVGNTSAAIRHLREALALTEKQQAGAKHRRLAPRQREEVAATAFSLAKALWFQSKGQPTRTIAETFAVAQVAAYSPAAEAINLRTAISVGGADSSDYERIIGQQAQIQKEVAKHAGKFDPESSAVRGETAERSLQLEQQRKLLAARLGRSVPDYWELRSPSPVPLATLQASRRNGELLRTGEALIYWLVRPGSERGLVFAVSRERSAMAEIGLTGDELAVAVRHLRDQIDPCGYGPPSKGCERRGITFDRAAANRLYSALLGDAKIQAVIGPQSISTLLIVPTGPLASLPPGLLVTSKPERGDDRSAETLRHQTDWLINSKAIAVLPSITTLRTLRSSARQNSSAPTTSLFMVAAPDFQGGQPVPEICFRPHLVRSPESAAFDPARVVQARLSLCPLPGTAAEAKALQRLLGGIALIGSEARESQLRVGTNARSLQSARIVAFATHGLVAGQLGVSEPALALAAPLRADMGDDGFLTASEAARLQLVADWIILSACNTAAPGNGEDTQALSGLAQAFFLAGAKGLLVSHWRVDDDATVALTSGAITLNAVGMSKAQSLRQASCAIRNGWVNGELKSGINYCGSDAPVNVGEGSDYLSHPANWAPFVFLGAP